MKKRILSLIMIIPIIAMLLVFGFSRTVNLFVDLTAEYLEWDYAEQEAFEFTPSQLSDGISLSAVVYPLNATNQDVVWTCEDVEGFDGYGVSADNPIAVIEGGKLKKLRDGAVRITASVSGSSVTKSFIAYLINADDDSSEPKFIIVQGKDTAEVSVKGNAIRDYGLYNLVNGNKEYSTESFTATVYPTSVARNLNAEIIQDNLKACADITISESNEFGKCTISLALKKDSNFNNVMLKIWAEGTEISTMLRFRIIDGVNVYSYTDLMYCTDEATAEKIILRTNLESSENVKTRKNSALFGVEKNGKIECEYTTMYSTYDVKYYLQTSGLGKEKAIVHVGVTFRDDVYGNGYTINAHELTYPSNELDGLAVPSTSDLFAGPLMFVSKFNCTCYGQDNIGFMIQGDGITIDNVTLKNCNNVSNLSNLDYVGTVLEVDGDDITLQNSIVQNGRTVVRTMSNDNFTIDACMLSYAREFILKVGTNEFVYATSPSGNYTRDEIPANGAYAFLSPETDMEGNPLAGDFRSTATVRNSYFHTSGVFCVGMDTHFAGSYLYKYDSTIYNMAATSYPSKLTLEGDVRFYDWKSVDGLDSTTLISVPSPDSENGQFANLFDISTIIEDYHKKHPEENIILDKDGKHYVHGGVAFFGGGRNLSVVEFNGLDEFSRSAFSDVSDPFIIGLEGINDFAGILQNAAGHGKFKFYMYNPTFEDITVGSMPEVSALNGYAV